MEALWSHAFNFIHPFYFYNNEKTDDKMKIHIWIYVLLNDFLFLILYFICTYSFVINFINIFKVMLSKHITPAKMKYAETYLEYRTKQTFIIIMQCNVWPFNRFREDSRVHPSVFLQTFSMTYLQNGHMSIVITRTQINLWIRQNVLSGNGNHNIQRIQKRQSDHSNLVVMAMATTPSVWSNDWLFFV